MKKRAAGDRCHVKLAIIYAKLITLYAGFCNFLLICVFVLVGFGTNVRWYLFNILVVLGFGKSCGFRYLRTLVFSNFTCVVLGLARGAKSAYVGVNLLSTLQRALGFCIQRMLVQDTT